MEWLVVLLGFSTGAVFGLCGERVAAGRRWWAWVPMAFVILCVSLFVGAFLLGAVLYASGRWVGTPDVPVSDMPYFMWSVLPGELCALAVSALWADGWRPSWRR